MVGNWTSATTTHHVNSRRSPRFRLCGDSCPIDRVQGVVCALPSAPAGAYVRRRTDQTRCPPDSAACAPGPLRRGGLKWWCRRLPPSTTAGEVFLLAGTWRTAITCRVPETSLISQTSCRVGELPGMVLRRLSLER
jgi:hypothetical protein